MDFLAEFLVGFLVILFTPGGLKKGATIEDMAKMNKEKALRRESINDFNTLEKRMDSIKTFETDITDLDLNNRKRLFYLLNRFCVGKYDAFTFAVNFNRIYDLEKEESLLKGKSLLTEKESKLYNELYVVNGMFLSTAGLRMIRKEYSKKDVLEKAKQIYLELRQKDN